MREFESQVPSKLVLPNPHGEPRVSAVLKSDRRQVSDRRMTSRGGRRATDAVEQDASLNPGNLRVNSVERVHFEPVGVGI